MKISKSAVSIAMIGLFAANYASALPDVQNQAPQESVSACVAEVSSRADFKGAGRVQHFVETREGRANGHIMSIETRVYGDVGDTLIREYKARCIINRGAEVKRFKIRQREI